MLAASRVVLLCVSAKEIQEYVDGIGGIGNALLPAGTDKIRFFVFFRRINDFAFGIWLVIIRTRNEIIFIYNNVGHGNKKNDK